MTNALRLHNNVNMSNKTRRNQNVNYLSKIKIDQVCISGKLWKNFTFAGEKGDF